MKVLITGAHGMVARAVAAHCLSMGDEVLALGRDELDITHRVAVERTLADLTPEAVFNCAAYTNVDGAENNVEVCFAANALGVENLAAACRLIGSQFVTISTDFVFDGGRPGFYSEEDVPAPQSVYARSKLEGERRALSAYDQTIVVRSGWIFGRGGTNFLSVVYDLLAAGGGVSAISDSFGTPTFTDHLARRLRQLAALGRPGIFHVVNSGPGTSYAEFARKVCYIAGFDRALIRDVSASDLKRPAPRPRNSRLLCLHAEQLGLEPLPAWDDALSEFIDGPPEK